MKPDQDMPHDYQSDSVTMWLNAVRHGDDQAASSLWDRYFKRLIALARKRLVKAPEYDEEDLALSVFDAFCRQLQDGGFESLKNRDEFWSMLVMLTVRKSNDQRRRLEAAKRRRPGDQEVSAEQAPDTAAPPDVSLMMADQCRHLIRLLDDAMLESVALHKLEGSTNDEIAITLNCSLRSVGRMLNLIRQIWRSEFPVLES